MKDLLTTSIGRFRLIAFLEGISFLVLLGIAMPLKYIWDLPEMVQIVGMAHGVLFISYILLTLSVKVELGWPIPRTLLALALSVVPFGTFYVTGKMLPRNAEQ